MKAAQLQDPNRTARPEGAILALFQVVDLGLALDLAQELLQARLLNAYVRAEKVDDERNPPNPFANPL